MCASIVLRLFNGRRWACVCFLGCQSRRKPVGRTQTTTETGGWGWLRHRSRRWHRRNGQGRGVRWRTLRKCWRGRHDRQETRLQPINGDRPGFPSATKNIGLVGPLEDLKRANIRSCERPFDGINTDKNRRTSTEGRWHLRAMASSRVENYRCRPEVTHSVLKLLNKI